MSDPQKMPDVVPFSTDETESTVRYPGDEVLAIVDPRDSREAVTETLETSGFLDAVLAPTGERKFLAAKLLAGHGGHFINFPGRFSIQQLAA